MGSGCKATSDSRRSNTRYYFEHRRTNYLAIDLHDHRFLLSTAVSTCQIKQKLCCDRKTEGYGTSGHREGSMPSRSCTWQPQPTHPDIILSIPENHGQFGACWSQRHMNRTSVQGDLAVNPPAATTTSRAPRKNALKRPEIHAV